MSYEHPGMCESMPVQWFSAKTNGYLTISIYLMG